MKLEEKARQEMDQLLEKAGWWPVANRGGERVADHGLKTFEK
jgi:hypothetical protein